MFYKIENKMENVLKEEDLENAHEILLKSYVELYYKYHDLMKKIKEDDNKENIIFKDLIISKAQLYIENKSKIKIDINKSNSIYNASFQEGNSKITDKEKHYLNYSLVNNNFEILFDNQSEDLKSSKSSIKNSSRHFNNLSINNFDINHIAENKLGHNQISEIKQFNNLKINQFDINHISERKIFKNLTPNQFEINHISEKKIFKNLKINQFDLNHISEKKTFKNLKINQFEINHISEKKIFKNLLSSNTLNLNFTGKEKKKNDNIISSNILNIKKKKKKEEIQTLNYDCVIEMKRMLDLLESGWQIYYSEEFNNYLEGKAMELLIGILGDKFSGKTFILNNLFNKKLINPNKDINSSLSFKIDEKNENIVFLDSLGSNLTPNYFSFEKIDKNLPEIEKEKRIKDNIVFTHINELFIRNFVLELSNVCLYVVSFLTNSELERLNEIKKKFNRKVIIIHNVKTLNSLNEIDDYYNNVLLKELELNKERIIGGNYYYYFSDEINEDKKERLLHLILGNDNILEMKKYNKEIIDFIKNQIRTKKKGNCDFMKKFQDFFKEFALQYFDVKLRDEMEEMSFVPTLKESKEIINESLIKIENNKIILEIKKRKHEIINLRFKNITLNFISGESKEKNVFIIKDYKMYYHDYFIVEFYPLREIHDEIKVEINRQYSNTYQEIIIKGKYKIQNKLNKLSQSQQLMKQDDIIIHDTIKLYDSYLFKGYVKKNQFFLKDYKPILYQDGKIILKINVDSEDDEDDVIDL